MDGAGRSHFGEYRPLWQAPAAPTTQPAAYTVACTDRTSLRRWALCSCSNYTRWEGTTAACTCVPGRRSLWSASAAAEGLAP